MNSRALKWVLFVLLSAGAVFVVWVVSGFFLYFGHTSGRNPRATFEHLVTKPVPASVHQIQESGFRAMDSVLRVLSFNIRTPDLQSILDAQKYKPVDADELMHRHSASRDEYLRSWELQIERLAKLKVHFTSDWQAYKLNDGGGQKYIFCNTNTSEAVFVADAG